MESYTCEALTFKPEGWVFQKSEEEEEGLLQPACSGKVKSWQIQIIYSYKETRPGRKVDVVSKLLLKSQSCLSVFFFHHRRLWLWLTTNSSVCCCFGFWNHVGRLNLFSEFRPTVAFELRNPPSVKHNHTRQFPSTDSLCAVSVSVRKPWKPGIGMQTIVQSYCMMVKQQLLMV